MKPSSMACFMVYTWNGRCCTSPFSLRIVLPYARENITSMYDAYHSLGGDGIVTDMVRQTMELPYKKGGESPFEQSR